MKTIKYITLLLGLWLGTTATGDIAMAGTETVENETATLAGGCFWCLEAVFEELEGVKTVLSGFAGGEKSDVTYKEVCSGETGHAEVVQVLFDPRVLSYAELLTVFFSVHDPTTLNRQGADVGTQYRSAIFWHDDSQRQVAEDLIGQLTDNKVFSRPIVTQVAPMGAFILADAYHQNYYRNNMSQGYCQAVINPKLYKFREKFADRLKN
jgi:peptide-methionine (S)-S-oxide reductase